MDYNPLLSIATATIELGGAVWAVRGGGRKPLLRNVAAILVFLAGYQIVEAIFCTGLLPFTGSLLPRLAFIVVAWLPPLGLWLVARLYPGAPRGPYWLAGGMFAACAALVAGIALSPDFVTESVCLVVFARYSTPTPLYQLYGAFYQFGLISMLALSAHGVTLCDDRHQRLLLGQVLLGSLAFIIPALIVVAVVPVADGALPSILCHFALLLAFFLLRLVSIERREAGDALAVLPLDSARGVAP